MYLYTDTTTKFFLSPVIGIVNKSYFFTGIKPGLM